MRLDGGGCRSDAEISCPDSKVLCDLAQSGIRAIWPLRVVVFVERHALTRFQELAPSVLPSEIVFHSNLAEKGRPDVGVELRAGAAEHLGNGIFETP